MTTTGNAKPIRNLELINELEQLTVDLETAITRGCELARRLSSDCICDNPSCRSCRAVDQFVTAAR